MNNAKLLHEIFNVLGNDEFMLTDLIDQERLFEIQDSLAKLICEAANADNYTARMLTKQMPVTFTTETVGILGTGNM